MMIKKLLKYIMLIKILWDEQMKYEFFKMNSITVYMHRDGHIPFWNRFPMLQPGYLYTHAQNYPDLACFHKQHCPPKNRHKAGSEDVLQER